MPEELSKSPGIYCIENLQSRKIYIGSSFNMQTRIYGHFWHLHKRIHSNKHLQRSYDKHQGENFIVFELELCEESKLIEREQLYLDTFLYAQEYIMSDGRDERFHHYGYNLSPTAGRTEGFRHSDESLEKIIENAKQNWKNPDYLKSQNKVRTKEWNEIRIKRGIETKNNDPTYKNRMSYIIGNSTAHHDKVRKPIIAYNRLTGEFIGQFESISGGAKSLNISPDRIAGVLQKKVKYSHDMHFTYKESDIYPLKIAPIPQYNDTEGRKKAMRKAQNKNKIPVLAYDLQGKFVGEYESQRECLKKLGTDPSGVLRGFYAQSNGYTFKYKDPNYNLKTKARRVVSKN